MVIDHSLIELSEKLNRNLSLFQCDQPNDTYSADPDAVIEWLTQDISCADKHQHFLLEQLRAGLLKNLRKHLLSVLSQPVLEASNQEDGDNASSVNELMFGLLLFSGTVLAVCEGYDYVTSILSCLTWIPSSVVCVVGLAFAMLSIMLFYGFDLEEISKNLNVKIITPLHLLDIYLQQVNEMEAIQQWLQRQIYDAENLQELEKLKVTLDMLVAVHHRLNVARYKFEQVLRDPFLICLKSATAILAGFIAFGSGYLASQSLSLTIVGLFLTSVSVTSLPVLAICSAIGLAAAGVYWHVERPGIENLIGKLMGLDNESMRKFEQETSLTLKLDNLENQLAIKRRNVLLREENERWRVVVEQLQSTPNSFQANRGSPISIVHVMSCSSFPGVLFSRGKQTLELTSSAESNCSFNLGGASQGVS